MEENEMYKRLKAPFVVQVEITEKCNNCCIHCYNYWRTKKEMSDFPLKEVVNLMEKLSKAEVFHLVLTGGEPLLNRKTLYCFLEEAKNFGITVGINSNLTLLEKKDVDFFKATNVVSVLTSILGSTPQKHDMISKNLGSFKKTVAGIDMLNRSGITIGVNMVISKKNLFDLRDTAKMVKTLGIDKFHATRAGCPGNCFDFGDLKLTLEEFRLYLENLYLIKQEEGMDCSALESYPLCAIKEIKRYSNVIERKCLAGVTSMTISVSGEIRPCSHLDVEYGNIFLEDLDPIWARLSEWSEGKLLPDSCRSCKLLNSCGGGCRMEAKMLGKSLSDKDPYVSLEDVDYTFDQFMKLQQEKNERNPELPKKIRINHKIRIRSESFGGVVFLGSKIGGIFNKEGIDFLNKIEKNKVYDSEDFCRDDKDIQIFLSQLYRKKILMKGGQ